MINQSPLGLGAEGCPYIYSSFAPHHAPLHMQADTHALLPLDGNEQTNARCLVLFVTESARMINLLYAVESNPKAGSRPLRLPSPSPPSCLHPKTKQGVVVEGIDQIRMVAFWAAPASFYPTLFGVLFSLHNRGADADADAGTLVLPPSLSIGSGIGVSTEISCLSPLSRVFQRLAGASQGCGL